MFFTKKSRTSIQNMNTSIYCFWPSFLWNSFICNHTSNHVEDNIVFSFGNTILLRCVGFCQLVLNSLLSTKIYKFLWHVFSSTIQLKGFDFSPNFIFNNFKAFENRECFRLSLQETNSSFFFLEKSLMKEIKYFFFPFDIGFNIWATYIRMNELI